MFTTIPSLPQPLLGHQRTPNIHNSLWCPDHPLLGHQRTPNIHNSLWWGELMKYKFFIHFYLNVNSEISKTKFEMGMVLLRPAVKYFIILSLFGL